MKAPGEAGTGRSRKKKPVETVEAAPNPPVRPFGCPVDTLKIGPFDYRLVFSDKEWQEREEAYGLHDPDVHIITLSNTRNRQQMADVAIHEINHAVWYVGRMDDVVGEENFCARHATGFITITRDNLEFMAWVLSLLADHNQDQTTVKR